MKRNRIIIDTNILISRLLTPSSVPAKAVSLALTKYQLIFSEETLGELIDVLRSEFISMLGKISLLIPILVTIKRCRDPNDDKFLSLAVSAGAKIIISGDKDLLILSSFRGISILSPKDFLDL